MEELLKKIDNLERLCLPNGSRNAVWLTDVEDVIREHFKQNKDGGK